MKKKPYLCTRISTKRYMMITLIHAPVAELVDAPDLGSGVSRRAGSSPVRRTFYGINIEIEQKNKVFIKKNINFLARLENYSYFCHRFI